MNYIISPIHGEAWCEFKLSEDENQANQDYIPKLAIHFNVNQFDMTLSQTQYHEIQSLFEFFHNYTKSYPFLKFKPHVSIISAPESWWCYLYRVVRKKHISPPWRKMKQFILDRKTYVDLWYRKKLENLVKEKFVSFFFL